MREFRERRGESNTRGEPWLARTLPERDKTLASRKALRQMAIRAVSAVMKTRMRWAPERNGGDIDKSSKARGSLTNGAVRISLGSTLEEDLRLLARAG